MKLLNQMLTLGYLCLLFFSCGSSDDDACNNARRLNFDLPVVYDLPDSVLTIKDSIIVEILFPEKIAATTGEEVVFNELNLLPALVIKKMTAGKIGPLLDYPGAKKSFEVSILAGKDVTTPTENNLLNEESDAFFLTPESLNADTQRLKIVVKPKAYGTYFLYWTSGKTTINDHASVTIDGVQCSYFIGTNYNNQSTSNLGLFRGNTFLSGDGSLRTSFGVLAFEIK